MQLIAPSAMPRIIIHSLDHARAAIAAAADLKVAVTLASAPGAGAYAGPLWFKSVIELAVRDHAELSVTAILDCADEPGTVLAALRTGLKQVRFTGPAAIRERLAGIAAQLGASIEGGDPPKALDLLGARDPLAACRRFLAGNQSRD